MPYVVKKGKTRVACSRTKALAKKAAARARAGGSKKVRYTKVKSCSR